MLAADFHDRAVSAGAISGADEMKNRRDVNPFTEKTPFRYLYTLLEKDGRFCFSAPAVTGKGELQRRRWYFDPFDDAPAASKKAFAEGTVQYANHTGRWGTFRSIALFQESPGARRHLFRADCDISYEKGLLQKSCLQAALEASDPKIRQRNRYLEALHRILPGQVRRPDSDDLLQDIIKQAGDLGDTRVNLCLPHPSRCSTPGSAGCSGR